MKHHKILLCGGCFAGNMGGDAMYETFIHQIKNKTTNYKISVLTKYPKDDEEICNRRGYNVFEFTTVERVFIGIPFFLLGGLLKLLHLPHKWLAIGSLKQYYENDVLVDFSGISFSDYRSFADLVINITWLLPAFVSGIPIIKMSQSLGPYNKITTHSLAKYALKRLDVIIARGDASYTVTKKLLPHKKNIYNLPDVAMCLPTANRETSDSILEKVGLLDEKYVVMAPSIVVDQRMGSDAYRKIMKAVVKKVYELTGMPILFTPHTRNLSAMIGVDSASDDMTVCEEVAKEFDKTAVRVEILKERYSATELKSVIARGEFAIGSRYHFLIAAMSSGVPSIALGWGHKYYEMFKLFNMEKYVFEYHEINEETVIQRVTELAENYLNLKTEIQEKLPEIKHESEKNVMFAIKLAERNQ